MEAPTECKNQEKCLAKIYEWVNVKVGQKRGDNVVVERCRIRWNDDEGRKTKGLKESSFSPHAHRNAND